MEFLEWKHHIESLERMDGFQPLEKDQAKEALQYLQKVLGDDFLWRSSAGEPCVVRHPTLMLLANFAPCSRRPSALRVDVEPRAPDSNQTVLLKEAFSYRVVWKIRPVGEADAVEDYVERVLFIGEHMLDAKPKLTRRCVGLRFNVLWMCFVKASSTVALYVEGETLSDVRRFPHIEGWVDKLFRPPVSVFDVDRALARPFEDDVSVSSHEISSRADPPEDVNSGALR